LPLFSDLSVRKLIPTQIGPAAKKVTAFLPNEDPLGVDRATRVRPGYRCNAPECRGQFRDKAAHQGIRGLPGRVVDDVDIEGIILVGQVGVEHHPWLRAIIKITSGQRRPGATHRVMLSIGGGGCALTPMGREGQPAQ
jgi:hypothetical protein